MRILAIDPGPAESAYVIWDGGRILEHAHMANEALKQRLTGNGYDELAIEVVAFYGQTVGKEVFETCYWIGRFDYEQEARLLPRREIRLHLCDTSRCGDPQVRRALLDRFGEQGNKKAPGPLYGISKHEWSALAVAVMAWELAQETERKLTRKDGGK